MIDTAHVIDFTGDRPVTFAAECLRCGHRHQLDGWTIGDRVRLTADHRGLAVALRGEVGTVVGQSYRGGPSSYHVELDGYAGVRSPTRRVVHVAPCELEDE